MSKWSKRISFLLVLILVPLLMYNLFSGKDQDNNEKDDYSHIYESKTNPLEVIMPVGEYVSSSPQDDALRYAKFWKIPEIYRRSSEDCINNYFEFHPTNHVKREGVFEYYGIKIGTDEWNQLVKAYENQAENICYSYSGYEAEDIWAQNMRNSFSESELKQIMNFYDTKLGNKLIDVSNTIGRTIQLDVSKRQANAMKRETDIFNETKEMLYAKHVQEHGNWLEKIWFKLFYKE